MVKTTASGVSGIADQHTDPIWGRLEVGHYKDLLSAFRFLVRRQGVGLGRFVLPDGTVEHSALMIGPRGFTEYALEPFLVVWEGHDRRTGRRTHTADPTRRRLYLSRTGETCSVTWRR
jgi:hypothetical protein